VKIQTRHKMITAIVPKGKAQKLVEQLVYELGISRVNVNHSRGLGRITPLRQRGIGETTEKEVVTVLIEPERAEEVFDFIFFEADINTPHGGLIYQQPTFASTPFNLPDLPEES